MTPAAKRSFELWFRVAGLVLVATALVAFLAGFYNRKFHLETGRASWIWIHHPLDEKRPIAFFAVKDIVVPPSPPLVRLRVASDSDWTFYLNGEEVAGGAGGSDTKLVTLDLSEIARKGVPNRVAFALRSATGVGGLLASIDFAPLRENDVVTDGSWQICRDWSPGVVEGAITCSERPLILGTPPFGRWNFPEATAGVPYRHQTDVPSTSGEAIPTVIHRREIRVIGGVAVESATDIPATRFDFGHVTGRVRVTLPEAPEEVTMVEVRYAKDASGIERVAELSPFVFAPGETMVTDPVPREIRFVAVGSSGATASVLPEAAAAPQAR